MGWQDQRLAAEVGEFGIMQTTKAQQGQFIAGSVFCNLTRAGRGGPQSSRYGRPHLHSGMTSAKTHLHIMQKHGAMAKKLLQHFVIRSFDIVAHRAVTTAV